MGKIEDLGRFLDNKLRASLKRGYLKAFYTIKDLYPNEKLILDVGCGKGELLYKLSDYKVFECGIDLNIEDLKIAKSKNLTIIIGDATNLSFREEIFDIVVSSQFFEHVWNVSQALNEQIKVLKKGEKLIIEQVNLLSIPALVNLILLLPIKTKGKRGGIKWLINSNKVTKSLYVNYPGRDEDVKTILWWKELINNTSTLSLVDIYSPLSKKFNISNLYLKLFVSFFSRGIIIIAIKNK